MLDSLDLNSTLAFEGNVPKALDVFKLETSTGADSRGRRYVVHNMDGDQKPILIFHSFENEMTINGDTLLLTINPHNSGSKYLCSIKLQNAYAASNVLKTQTSLHSQGLENNLQDLEALGRNTYP